MGGANASPKLQYTRFRNNRGHEGRGSRVGARCAPLGVDIGWAGVQQVLASLDFVDVKAQWTEQIAVRNKAQVYVFAGT
jgi:hypothetical protein